ncbi:MAG: hypothetical protein DRI57_24565, partial [Deltaproteobacteria bacterium]
FLHQTSNIKHQTSNIKHQTSNIKHQTSNINFLILKRTMLFKVLLAVQKKKSCKNFSDYLIFIYKKPVFKIGRIFFYYCL